MAVCEVKVGWCYDTDQNSPGTRQGVNMDAQPDPVMTCPFCGSSLQMGCLMGKDSLFAFQWYEGDPSFWKNLYPHGDSVGETAMFSGTYLKGGRCEQCRKIVLDY